MNRNKKIRDKYYEREADKDRLLYDSKVKKYTVKKRGKQHREEGQNE